MDLHATTWQMGVGTSAFVGKENGALVATTMFVTGGMTVLCALLPTIAVWVTRIFAMDTVRAFGTTPLMVPTVRGVTVILDGKVSNSAAQPMGQGCSARTGRVGTMVNVNTSSPRSTILRVRRLCLKATCASAMEVSFQFQFVKVFVYVYKC